MIVLKFETMSDAPVANNMCTAKKLATPLATHVKPGALDSTGINVGSNEQVPLLNSDDG